MSTFEEALDLWRKSIPQRDTVPESPEETMVMEEYIFPHPVAGNGSHVEKLPEPSPGVEPIKWANNVYDPTSPQEDFYFGYPVNVNSHFIQGAKQNSAASSQPL